MDFLVWCLAVSLGGGWCSAVPMECWVFGDAVM